MKKFDVAFKEASKNRFPYLRFVRAEYSKSANKLTNYFLLRYDVMDSGVFNDDLQKEVNAICASLLPDELTFSNKYVKAYADADIVKAKFMQYLSKKEPVICGRLADEDIKIVCDEYYIKISIVSNPNVNAILNDEEFKENLLDELYCNFVENITLDFTARYITDTEKSMINAKIKENYDKSVQNNVINVSGEGEVTMPQADAFSHLFNDEERIVVFENTRLVNAKIGKSLWGKKKPAAAPSYICDVKDSYERAVLCGTVSSVRCIKYDNKNLNKKIDERARFKPNTTDAQLVRYVFAICDTTGTFPIICFPQVASSEVLDTFLRDGETVVCEGRLRRNNFDEFQMTVNGIWLADIDFSSIKTEKPQRRESSTYKVIKPEKYVETEQATISDIISAPETPEFLKGKTFVAFDLETTGTDTSSVKIVQLGAAKIADGKIVETMATLVNPECPIPPESTAIHGITDDMVLSAPLFGEIVGDFYKFTRGATLVGQNVFGFDLPIINRMAKEEGYVFDNPVMDTLIMARQQLSLPRNNLDMICKHFGIILTNAHSADADALATAKCFMKLVEDKK